MGRRRGVENVKVNVVRGSDVGVVDYYVHDFPCGVLDVAEVDGDVLLTADGALGEITQLLKWRREGIVSHCVFASCTCTGSAFLHTVFALRSRSSERIVM